MNGIVGVAFGFLTVFSPETLPNKTQPIFEQMVPDTRIVEVLETAKDAPDYIQDATKIFNANSVSWKKERQKNISPFMGEDPVTLQVWLYDKKPDDLSWQKKVFEDSAENITLRIRTFSEEDIYYQELKKSLIQNTTPDIIMMKNGWVSVFENRLADIPEELFSLEECTDFFFEFSCNAFSHDEKMLGLPLSVKSLVFFYNTDLFLDDRIFVADKPAEDWKGFLENREKFKRFYQKEFIFAELDEMEKKRSLLHFFFALLAQVDEDTEPRREVMEEAFALIQTIFSPTKKGTFENFLSGKVALYLGTEDDLHTLMDAFAEPEKRGRELREEAVSIAFLPYISRENKGTYGESWGFVIPSRSEHKNPAAAFLAFMAEEENIDAFSKRTGDTPARVALVQNEIFKEAASTAKTPPEKLGSLEFERAFTEKIEGLLQEEKTPTEAAEALEYYFLGEVKSEEEKKSSED